MSNDTIALEDAVYWLICERSAQMGEAYTREMHEAAKLEDQDYISDIRFQVKSAIKAYEAASQPVQEFTLLGVLADIRQKTGVGDKVMLSELADTLAALIQNGDSAIDTNKRLADKLLERESGWVATMDKSAPVRHHLLLWSSLKPDQGIQYCYYDISDAEWYWFNDYGQAIEFVAPTHWQLPEIPTTHIEDGKPL